MPEQPAMPTELVGFDLESFKSHFELPAFGGVVGELPAALQTEAAAWAAYFRCTRSVAPLEKARTLDASTHFWLDLSINTEEVEEWGGVALAVAVGPTDEDAVHGDSCFRRAALELAVQAIEDAGAAEGFVIVTEAGDEFALMSCYEDVWSNLPQSLQILREQGWTIDATDSAIDNPYF